MNQESATGRSTASHQLTRATRRQLEILVGLGEDLHFSRAADRLGIAQPTLSKELRRFEKQLTFRDCSAGGRTARG